ncbi:hypothetical protein J4462_01760 [Candidatus Pacearchaeota archaeon]|nr:hypothetical protein [Candidatus Pacearchaeota archaeon]
MVFTRVDNYDGRKGYVGEERIEVWTIRGIKYLLTDTKPLLDPTTKQLMPNLGGYKVYRVIKENLETDNAIVQRITNQKTLLDLTKELESKYRGEAIARA